MNITENDNLTKLIADVQNGVEGSFEQLYKATIRFSYSIASLLLTNKEDIEDALQNSYMYVARSIKDLKNPDSFENWLSTIVKHECQKYIAKHKRASDIFSAVLRSKEFELPVEDSLPFDLIERKEVSDSVRKIINGLPADKRACVVLYYFGQNSLPEIAEILGVPEGTVKSRLYTARKTIEKEIKKLRKSNDTLFGISAIPLIVAFFTYQAQHVSIPTAVSEGAAVCATAATAGSVASSVSATAASAAATTSAAAGTTAAAGSTAAAGATAGVAVTTKVAAVAVAAAVATGGGAATVGYVNSKKEAVTTLPLTSITEEYTTAAAIFKETTLVVNEMSTEYPTTETTSVKNVTEASLTVTTTAVITEKPTSTSAHTTARKTTTKKHTTKPITTAVVSTTVLTTDETTTKEVTTTVKETTTQPTTKKETTTVVPTTDATDIYSVSNGVLGEYTGEGSDVSVPSSVGGDSITAIGTGAFAGNGDITSVSLPSTVTKVGQEAFADCTKLKNVSLPSSLQSIGIGAFCGCTSLTSVSIPSGVTTIGDDAFADCSSLSSVTIPSSVTSIGDNAFGGCDNLTIKCPEGSAAHDYAVENSIEFELI